MPALPTCCIFVHLNQFNASSSRKMRARALLRVGSVLGWIMYCTSGWILRAGERLIECVHSRADLLVRYALAFLTLPVLIVTASASNRKAESCFVEVTTGNETFIDQTSSKIMREAVYLGIGVGCLAEIAKAPVLLAPAPRTPTVPLTHRFRAFRFAPQDCRRYRVRSNHPNPWYRTILLVQTWHHIVMRQLAQGGGTLNDVAVRHPPPACQFAEGPVCPHSRRPQW